MNNEKLSQTYPLPPQHLRFMGENDAQYMKIGDLNVQMLDYALPLTKIQSILDIGCGYGRLAHALLRCEEFTGTYYGFDILPNHVSWCQKFLSPHGNFYFKHLDIQNARYNPAGMYQVKDLDFSSMPKVDIVSFYSVFTHLYEDDIRTYLKKISKAFKQNTKILCTAFLYSQTVKISESEGKSRYPMPFCINEYTRYHNKQDPLHAICYDEYSFLDILKDCGFQKTTILYGGWCGRKVETKIDPFQDLIIAERIK